MDKAKTFSFKSRIKSVKPSTEANRIRATTQWRKVSRLKRRMNPLCEDPFGAHEREGVSQPVYDAHHIKPLEEAPHLAYDLDNLLSVCRGCHARLENGGEPARCIVVYGPPASGKNHYLNQHYRAGDMVIDLDAIHTAMGGQHRQEYGAFHPFVMAAHDAVIARLRHPSQMQRAWILTTTPTVRDRCRDELHAQVVAIAASEEQCIERARADATRAATIDSQCEMIREWFEKYEGGTGISISQTS